MITTRKINQALDLKAEHCMYDKMVKWYHHLKSISWNII